jgi:hypothetical protein
MTKLPNKVGGGARTNLNGLQFEGRTDLREAIRQHPIYDLNEMEEVVKGNMVVAKYFEKYGLYKKLLEPKGINYKKFISKKLLPDGALLVGNTLYIIEKNTKLAQVLLMKSYKLAILRRSNIRNF